MQASRWQEVQEIFDAALRMPPAERDVYLAEACGDDAALLGDVTTMLNIHQRSKGDDKKPTKRQAPTEEDTVSLIGKTVGPYEIDSRIGVGGMGVVYKAHDSRLDRFTALKCLPLNMVSDKMARERFINEAKAASRLDHPNICAIFDIGELPDGQLYIAMPYYDGSTLAKMIKKGPMHHAEATNIIHNIAQGLRIAHEHDIVHRDIKPANIMLTNDGGVKILDFGVAKMAGVEMTGTGVSVGTAAYMAPEQLTGSKIDHRVDIWALGAVLFEMLNGKRAFPGDNVYAMIYSIINSDLEFSDNIPDYLLNVLRNSLVKNVDERFNSIEEFIAHLIADEEAVTSIEQVNHNLSVPNDDHAGWNEELLELIAHVYTRYLGPIAPVLVKKEALKHEELDALLNALAEKLEDEMQRENFIHSAHKKIKNPNSHSSSGLDTVINEITPEQVTEVEDALRYHLGPVASAMVKRALHKNKTYENLVMALSESLDSDAERKTFRTKLGLDN